MDVEKIGWAQMREGLHKFVIKLWARADGLYSAMSERKMRRSRGVLLPGPDTERGRADDFVFQVLQVWQAVE